jgi:hypothetical protein
MMTEFVPRHGVYYGINALNQFQLSFESWTNSNDCSIFESIFKQLTPVVNQRKRFKSFLCKYFENNTPLISHYDNIACSWEIFRNMCFKIKTNNDNEIKKRVLARLASIVQLEETGITMLRGVL